MHLPIIFVDDVEATTWIGEGGREFVKVFVISYILCIGHFENLDDLDIGDDFCFSNVIFIIKYVVETEVFGSLGDTRMLAL